MVIGIAGCDSPPQAACSYGGRSYIPGQQFPASDGCRTCTCLATGEVACGTGACATGTGGGAAPGPGGSGGGATGDGTGGSGAPVGTGGAAGGSVGSGGVAGSGAAGSGAAGSGAGGAAVGSGGRSATGGSAAGGQPGSGGRAGAGGGGRPGTGGSAGVGGAAGGPDGGSTTCTLSSRFQYGDVGGLRIHQDSVIVSPPAQYEYRRSPAAGDGVAIACSPPFPTCDDPSLIDLADLLDAVAHPDVQQALAMPAPPFYGRDTRPADGTAFVFLRADGRGFLVGSACRAADCPPIPPGIAKLAALLQMLDRQQLAAPSCAALRR